jgi:unsaturated chondroitin disaccharide hydrolase
MKLPFQTKNLFAFLLAVLATARVMAHGTPTASDSSLNKSYRKITTALNIKPVADKGKITGAAAASDAAFRAGILWYAYEYSKDEQLKAAAMKGAATVQETALAGKAASYPDYLLYALGNGSRMVGDSSYNTSLNAAAALLSNYYDTLAGVIVSPEYRSAGWVTSASLPNLELLFRAAKKTGITSYYDHALKHATTFLVNYVRNDSTVHPVLMYDTAGQAWITPAGMPDSTFDAGSQADAIYGFTMIYRMTRRWEFRVAAEVVADAYIRRFPAGRIPLISAANGTDTYSDVRSAAMTAAALLELGGLGIDNNRKRIYFAQAMSILKTLSSPEFQDMNSKQATLLNTGSVTSPAYQSVADYYYMQALLRLKKLGEQKPLDEPL